MIRLALAITIATILYAASTDARAHFRPGRHNVVHAINLAWCGKSRLHCHTARQAVTVATCESRLWPYAANGQYLGTFQMGSYARSRFGHGWDPWTQARAAHRYWREAGWRPWACSPYGGVRW